MLEMPADQVRTNVDFCDHIEELATQFWDTARPLPEYLLALWQLASAHKDMDALPFTEFVGALDRALDEPAPAIDLEQVRAAVAQAEQGGFWRWQAIVLSQALDLARRIGKEQDGVIAAEGGQPPWNNTSTMAFLEAGAVTVFDGWVSGDEEGGSCGTGGCGGGGGGCGGGGHAERPSVAQIKKAGCGCSGHEGAKGEGGGCCGGKGKGEGDGECDGECDGDCKCEDGCCGEDGDAFEVESISWDLFSDFLVAGQLTE